MKKQELKDLKNKPLPELARLLRENQERLRSLRFDLAAGKVKNVREIRLLRRDIARILTFMRMTDGKG